MSQVITRQMVEDKLAAHLQHLSLTDLVAWAENALMNEEFEEEVKSHYDRFSTMILRNRES